MSRLAHGIDLWISVKMKALYLLFVPRCVDSHMTVSILPGIRYRRNAMHRYSYRKYYRYGVILLVLKLTTFASKMMYHQTWESYLVWFLLAGVNRWSLPHLGDIHFATKEPTPPTFSRSQFIYHKIHTYLVVNPNNTNTSKTKPSFNRKPGILEYVHVNGFIGWRRPLNEMSPSWHDGGC